MKIAIFKEKGVIPHSTTWTNPWEEYCNEEGLDYELVDLYKTDAVEKLKE